MNSETTATKVALTQAMIEQFGPGRWVTEEEEQEHRIDECPECGTTELLCGYPRQCCTEDKTA